MMLSMIPSSLAISLTSVFVRSAIGERSTPPSPYFVNPTPKSSTLLPVPTTKYY